MLQARILALSLSILLSTSCVGLKTQSLTSIATPMDTASKHNDLLCDMASQNQLFNKPASKVRKTTHHIEYEWIEDQRSWVGITPYIIIPIPLKLPVHHKTTLTCDAQNHYVSQTIMRAIEHIAACNFFYVFTDAVLNTSLNPKYSNFRSKEDRPQFYESTLSENHGFCFVDDKEFK